MLSGSTATNKFIVLLSDGEPTRAYQTTDGTFTNIKTTSDCSSYWFFGTYWDHAIKATYDSFTPTTFNYNRIISGNAVVNKTVSGT